MKDKRLLGYFFYRIFFFLIKELNEKMGYNYNFNPKKYEQPLTSLFL